MVDIAALRDAMVNLGGNPEKVNPQVPVDLVIDHSVQVDISGLFPDARERNLEIEYQRNMERYKFLKWGQMNLDNFRAVPPGRGIVHQVNLEWIASVARHKMTYGFLTHWLELILNNHDKWSRRTWLGCRRYRSEAVMLGQPIYVIA